MKYWLTRDSVDHQIFEGAHPPHPTDSGYFIADDEHTFLIMSIPKQYIDHFGIKPMEVGECVEVDFKASIEII